MYFIEAGTPGEESVSKLCLLTSLHLRPKPGRRNPSRFLSTDSVALSAEGCQLQTAVEVYPVGDSMSPQSDSYGRPPLITDVAATRHSLALKMHDTGHAEPDQRRPEPGMPKVSLTSPYE